MVTSYEIKQYAIIAAANILAKLSEKEAKTIHAVILFGSVAQNIAAEDSDIDLFFDVEMSKSGQKTLRARINNIISEFLLSQQALAFKINGIDNKISIAIGRLDKWSDLKKNISGNSIVLYEKYQSRAKAKKTEKILFSWENVNAKVRGAFLNKMYGYRAGKKQYKGMVEKLGGSRIGKAVIIIPITQKDAFMEVLMKYKIQYTIYEI